MGFGGGPWFVVKKDISKNILYVSHGYDPETAYKQNFLYATSISSPDNCRLQR